MEIGEGAEQQVFFEVKGPLGVEEVVQRRLVALRQRRLQFVAGRPEAGTPEQVPHELDLAQPSPLNSTVAYHGKPSRLERFARADVPATVEHSATIVNAVCMDSNLSHAAR